MASHWPCRSCALGLSRACRSRRCTRSCRVLGCWGVRWCLMGVFLRGRAGGWVQDAGTPLPGLAWRPFDLRPVGEGGSARHLGDGVCPVPAGFFPSLAEGKILPGGAGGRRFAPRSCGVASGKYRGRPVSGRRTCGGGTRKTIPGVPRPGAGKARRPLDLQGPEPGCLRGGDCFTAPALPQRMTTSLRHSGGRVRGGL